MPWSVRALDNVIPLSHPDITDADIHAVSSVLKSGRLSIGPHLESFEQALATRIGRSHGVGVSSGTAALHLALIALGVGPGDEVITPAFSFVASANCILYVGATPVFVDCDPRTLNMHPDQVEKHITSKTKAIIGVEVFGNPAGMDQLAALSTKYEIPLIEDACEGLGGHLGETPIGRFGRVAVFGFYPNKQITTGEGGMIVTDDDCLAATCRSLRNHGRAEPDILNTPASLGGPMCPIQMGYNFRLSELHAALGHSQIHRLDQLIESRQWVAETYTRRLMGNRHFILPNVEPNAFVSWFVYVIRLTDHFTEDDRDFIMGGLRRHDVGVAAYFPVIPLLAHFREIGGYMPGDFPVAESVSHRTLALPFFPGITEDEIELACQTLEVMISRISYARD